MPNKTKYLTLILSKTFFRYLGLSHKLIEACLV